MRDVILGKKSCTMYNPGKGGAEQVVIEALSAIKMKIKAKDKAVRCMFLFLT